MKLGFIGTGVITEAIVTGLLSAEYPVAGIIVSERSREVSTRLAATSDRVRVTADNQEIADQADVVFLAVLPQVAERVLRPIRFRDGQKVVSLIATMTHERLHSWIGDGVEITRAIPLPAVAERRGVTVIYPASGQISNLFSCLGTAVTADSIAEFDAYAAASALMGTYFGVLETATGWLCAQGCAEQDAQAYLTGVFLGLARRAEQDTGSSFSKLRVAHSTAGGLNEQMYGEFTGSGGTSALTAALDSVAARLLAAKPPSCPDEEL